MEHQLESFRASLPTHIYTTDNLSHGLYRCDADHAIRNKYIEFNPKNSINYLAFDIDRPISHDEITDDLFLPPPTFFIQNPINRHAHVIYQLETAVHKNGNSSQKAIKYAAVIESAYRRALDADMGYAGLIIKNPTHKHWLTYSCRSEPYSLGELADYVDLTPLRAQKVLETSGLGRNCLLFDELRNWAYKSVDEYRGGTYELWLKEVISNAGGRNIFTIRLPESEINSISKSVASWVWSKYTGKGANDGVKRGRDAGKGAGLELRDKQVLAATITNRQRVGETEEAIKVAVLKLQANGDKITRKSVSIAAKVSESTVKRYRHLLPKK